jgi:hypothetical protein
VRQRAESKCRALYAYLLLEDVAKGSRQQYYEDEYVQQRKMHVGEYWEVLVQAVLAIQPNFADQQEAEHSQRERYIRRSIYEQVSIHAVARHTQCDQR